MPEALHQSFLVLSSIYLRIEGLKMLDRVTKQHSCLQPDAELPL